MKKYAVKLIYKYSDIIHVEAENGAEALSKALSSEIQEEYECFYDSETKEEDE